MRLLNQILESHFLLKVESGGFQAQQLFCHYVSIYLKHRHFNAILLDLKIPRASSKCSRSMLLPLIWSLIFIHIESISSRRLSTSQSVSPGILELLVKKLFVEGQALEVLKGVAGVLVIVSDLESTGI